jgi:uncharacterized damage-inducible protein DinB
MHAQMLLHQIGVAQVVVDRNTAGITHDESLRRPPGGGNSLNWVVGHMAATYAQVLALLGASPGPPDEALAAYAPGRGAPGDADALPLDVLLRRFREGGRALGEAVGRLGPDDFARPAGFSPTGKADETVGSLLSSIAFHQAYHGGQTGVLRRLLGRPGAIVGPGEKAPPAA